MISSGRIEGQGRHFSVEQWEWSSFRSYLYQETGLVRVKSQEWPTEIKARPVAKFGKGRVMSRPLSLWELERPNRTNGPRSRNFGLSIARMKDDLMPQ